MSAFDGIPLAPAEHFAVNVHAAVYRLIVYARRLGTLGGLDADGLFARYPFLRAHLEQMSPYLPDGMGWEETAAWWHAELEAWEAGAADPTPPLLALARAGQLDAPARTALVIAGIAEEDSRMAGLLADMHPGGGRGATLETLARIADADHWTLARALVVAGLVEPADPSTPRAQWVPRVPAGLWEAIRGHASEAPEPGMAVLRDASVIGELVLDPAVAARVRELPAVLAREPATTLVVRGMRGSDREDVAGAVARALGLVVLRVGDVDADDGEDAGGDRWRRAGALCTALGAMPLLVLDLAPGETVTLARPPGYDGPLAIVLAAEGGVSGPAMVRSITLELPPEGAEERRRHWERALPDQPVAELTERFLLGAAHLRRAAAEAVAIAALDRRDEVIAADVREACRSLNRQLLDTLATHLEPAGTGTRSWSPSARRHACTSWSAVAATASASCARLAPSLRGGATRGVRALFTGASGTGKTMAAQDPRAPSSAWTCIASTSPRSSTSTSARRRRTCTGSCPPPRSSTSCC